MFQYIKRILVVDEASELKSSIVRHLRRNGFVMDSAYGDEDAQRKIVVSWKNGLRVDLVIRIVQVHDPICIDFIEWIHKHVDISTIVISGWGDTGWVRAILKPEKDELVPNPLTPVNLMNAIHRIEDKLHTLQNSGGIPKQ
ncbi:MAG: hypothetical protein V1844_03235 [Pseudomonadota bacterium]